MAVDPRDIEKTLSHAELVARFRYEPETGFWFNCKTGRKIGQPRKPDGYVKIYIDDWRPFAHRLAWFYMTKKWPTEEIDHRDNDASNNAWDNLRVATRVENARNYGISVRNKTGVKGVHLCKQTGKYRASIRLNGKTKSLPRFDSLEEAAQAYAAAAREHYGEFARLDRAA